MVKDTSQEYTSAKERNFMSYWSKSYIRFHNKLISQNPILYERVNILDRIEWNIVSKLRMPIIGFYDRHYEKTAEDICQKNRKITKQISHSHCSLFSSLY